MEDFTPEVWASRYKRKCTAPLFCTKASNHHHVQTLSWHWHQRLPAYQTPEKNHKNPRQRKRRVPANYDPVTRCPMHRWKQTLYPILIQGESAPPKKQQTKAQTNTTQVLLIYIFIPRTFHNFNSFILSPLPRSQPCSKATPKNSPLISHAILPYCLSTHFATPSLPPNSSRFNKFQPPPPIIH